MSSHGEKTMIMRRVELPCVRREFIRKGVPKSEGWCHSGATIKVNMLELKKSDQEEKKKQSKKGFLKNTL